MPEHGSSCVDSRPILDFGPDWRLVYPMKLSLMRCHVRCCTSNIESGDLRVDESGPQKGYVQPILLAIAGRHVGPQPVPFDSHSGLPRTIHPPQKKLLKIFPLASFASRSFRS